MKPYVICAAAAAVAVLATGSQAATRSDASVVDGFPLIIFAPAGLSSNVVPIEEARRGRGQDDGPGHIRGGGDDGTQHARRGRGQDDGPGHIRGGGDDGTQHARRGRGADDGPGHIRHGRGADDPAGHA